MQSIGRAARVGDILPRRLVDRPRARRLEASALLIPGANALDTYRSALEDNADEFAGWDGRVVVTDADGEPAHRLLVVDRYRQVYAVHDAADAADLPDAGALSEWFRFLATACPECGVLDEPILSGPTL
ncbi:MAG: hypothetical protein M3Y40_07330 [Chloroflexota bacterium]|nr:hypothetical protein [Chloroflexota bacterium]